MKTKQIAGAILIITLALMICPGKYFDSEITANDKAENNTTEQTETTTLQEETTTVFQKEQETTKQINIVVKNPNVKTGYIKNKPFLTWNKDKNNTGYEVWMSDKKNGKYKKTASVTKNRFSLKNLKSGKVYYIKVNAFKKVNSKIYKSTKKVKPVKVLTNIKFKGAGSLFAKTVNVKWTPSKDVSGYYIQYSSNKNFKKAKSLKIKDKSLSTSNIYDLKPGKKYYVRMRAYKNSGKNKIYSLWSGAKTVKPAGIAAIADGLYKNTDGYFKDSVFIGDSVLQGFQIYVKSKGRGYLDNTKVNGVVSYSLIAAVQSSSKYHPLYRGKHMAPENYVKALGAKKVFLSFGINDIQNTKNPEYTYQNYKTLINHIKRVNPGVKIHILSTTPPMKGSNDYVNYAKRIRLLNDKMRAYCDKTDCEFIDIATYLSTSDGYLKPELCSDNFVHQVIPAYAIWDKVLRAYAWNYNY